MFLYHDCIHSHGIIQHVADFVPDQPCQGRIIIIIIDMHAYTVYTIRTDEGVPVLKVALQQPMQDQHAYAHACAWHAGQDNHEKYCSVQSVRIHTVIQNLMYLK